MSASKTSLRSRSSNSLNSRIPSTRSSVLSLASTQKKLMKKDFSKFYVELCHLQHSRPLQMIKQNLDRGVLDIIGDRIKFDEWYPIVSALRSDETLHSIGIRLRHRITAPLLEADTDLKARNITNHPVIVTKFVLYWLLESIKSCLTQSTSLTILELDGIPISGGFLELLCEGVLEAKCLQHLSLSKCGIQDDGLEVVCMAVRKASTLVSLNFSYCQFTHVGAMLLAKLISIQKLRRYSEAWAETLRYRDPDIETMHGLRRITLNHNPEIGDRGMQYLIDEIRDDLWLRAFDIQNTGVTEAGARSLIQLVRDNPNLVVVDARENPEIPNSCLSQIMTILAINNADKNDSEYKWINTSKIDCSDKNSTERKDAKATVKPWSCSVPYSKNLSVPKITTRKRSQSSCNKTDVPPPLWRTQIESYKTENEYLCRQLKVLNEILGREAKHKSDLIRENQFLKETLEKCRIEKRQIEQEFATKPILSEETLSILDETLSRLAIMYSNKDDGNGEFADIPTLLRNIKLVLNNSDNNDVELMLKDMKPNDLKFDKRRVIEQTIVEDVEPTYNYDFIDNAPSCKAQQIFSKMLRKKQITREGKSNKWPSTLSSSSDEASS